MSGIIFCLSYRKCINSTGIATYFLSRRESNEKMKIRIKSSVAPAHPCPWSPCGTATSQKLAFRHANPLFWHAPPWMLKAPFGVAPLTAKATLHKCWCPLSPIAMQRVYVTLDMFGYKTSVIFRSVQAKITRGWIWVKIVDVWVMKILETHS